MEYFLVTGSRDFPEEKADVIHKVLDSHLRWHPDSVMINGMATGVDTICAMWAARNGVVVEPHFADWNTHGKSAGPIRNKKMLDRLLEERSSTVFAFSYGPLHESRGTNDMVTQCIKRGVQPTIKVVDKIV